MIFVAIGMGLLAIWMVMAGPSILVSLILIGFTEHHPIPRGVALISAALYVTIAVMLVATAVEIVT